MLRGRELSVGREDVTAIHKNKEIKSEKTKKKCPPKRKDEIADE
jgi:hypothetical protein